ncbi:MAG: ORF6N domain-containing protein [Clostridium perfringens]|nr:ORF6N domain-containing protein [Clostridium perfringens]
MNNLIVNGMKNIDGMKFHDIEGGFGEGKKAMLVKEIANIHNKDLRVINQNIERNRERFKDDIDIVDLKGTDFAITLSDSGIYTQNSINASKNIYLLSERGYSKLLKILEDDVAWEQYDKLVDGYFNMRSEIKENSFDISELSTELQMFNKMLQAVAKSELEQKKIKQQLNEVNHHALEAKEKADKSIEEIQAMREVVATNTTNWREDCRKTIVKIAHKLGGNSHIHDVQTEVYSLMRTRLKCKLDVKLTNMRRRMAEEGICKSKRDKKNYLDVIEDDVRLKEGYIAIVKDLAFKHGVA